MEICANNLLILCKQTNYSCISLKFYERGTLQFEYHLINLCFAFHGNLILIDSWTVFERETLE